MATNLAQTEAPRVIRTAGLAVLVFVVGCVMGWPSLRGEFLSGDDVHLVLDHVLVNHPSLAHAWELICIVHRDLYQPVPMLSFSLDFAVINVLGLTPLPAGPDAGAWVFHLTNVLIHALNGVLVFWLMLRLDSANRSLTVAARNRWAVPLIAALLFLLHPYAAEVVGWLNGRMMLLATLFSLASLIAADAYLVRGRWLHGVLLIVFVVLAMTSKVRVGLPVLLVIPPLARKQWPARRWWVFWVVAGILTAAFTALNVVSTSASEMFQGAAESMEGSRIARTILVLAWYFGHYVWPVNMSPWHPPEPLVLWSHPGIPLAVGALLVLAVAVVVSWRWTRIGVLGMLWFLATVASTLPLIPSRDVMAADRYVYLPNIGLHWITAAMLAYGVVWISRRFGGAVFRWSAAGLGAAAAVALLPYTWTVLGYYESNIAKAERIAEVYPDVPGVWEDIGWAYYRDGRYEDAIEAGQRDIDLNPEVSPCEALQLIGMAQYRLGRVDEGIATLNEAVAANPKYGKCYSRLGHIYYELGRYEDSEPNYVKAIEIMPEYLPGVQALGHLYRRMGRIDDAVRWYERCLELNDFDPVSTMALAEIEMERGKYPAAIARFERLLSWQPENGVARINLGVCYAQTGRTAEAMKAYETVMEDEPAAVTAAMNVAVLRIEMGDDAGAAAVLESALVHAPLDRTLLVAAHDLYVRLNRLPQAARVWANALKLQPDATDLSAWYAWTCALAGRWAEADRFAQAALSRDEGQGMALSAKCLVAVMNGDPDAADHYLDNLLSAPTAPADAAKRLMNALAAVGQRSPDEPWPYFFVARLLLADGQKQPARLGFEEFIRRCSAPEWKERAQELIPSE